MRIARIFGKLFKSLMRYKKILFLYLPLMIALIIFAYTGVVYLQWVSDKDMALSKLTRYKSLIDRTEELREGFSYSYSEIDLSAKVVDIPTRIYDRKGEIIGEYFEEKREIVPYSYIPQWLVKGVIASEDRLFYEHNGISYKGIFRAMVVNLIHLRVVQGGSTITQQLAKVLFTDMQRNFKRKIYEAFCALEIEKKYDKQDILSMYLNLIYFGNGAYGVESTSRMFFGRSVKELNEVECSMIVATISNPLIYSPIANLNNSIRKTRRILTSLVDAGFLSEKRADYQYKVFLKKWDVTFDDSGDAVTSLIGSSIYSSYRINRAPFFNETIRRVLVERFGDEAIKKGGLEIHTTIDATTQDIALDELRKGIEGQREYHRKRAENIKSKTRSLEEKQKADNIEGALVSIDPFSGSIIAYVGGSNFSIDNQNDHVAQIRRQPGSSFKPVIYAAAVQSEDITPSTVFIDEETEFEGGYAPKNYDMTYKGPVIAREALRKSINIVAVKVLEKTGYDDVMDIIGNSLDLSSYDLNKRFGETLSLALGTYEISPLENCILHSVLVNGGNFVYPYGIRQVKDYNGNIVWDNELEINKKIIEMRRRKGKIIDSATASVIISMLQGVFEPGGTAYYSILNRGISFPVAGKTGTSANFVDAWFAGYTSNLVTVIWIGNKKGAISLGEGRAGGVVAAPIWGAYISKIFIEESDKPAEFYTPEHGITRERICIDSGEVAGRNGECPVSVMQVYRSGSEPGQFCHIHVTGTNQSKEKIKDENNEN